MFNLNIIALKNAYKNNDTTAKELIFSLRQQALEQAEYNAWITLLDETKLTEYLSYLEGKTIDELPLYGVPFAIKDNIDLAGVPTTAACPDFEYTPSKSAFVVEQLMKAGAIPLGKTNLDQFATGLVGMRSPYGEGVNAFNTDYVSGGSSAGSAISTALGQVSFALGTDTAGSGRVPAALNNLIGHKPTKGLFSNSGLVPACLSLDCITVFALNTQDAALVTSIAGQYDEADSYARPNKPENHLRYFEPKLPQNFTFGVPAELDFYQNPETKALFEQTVERLENLGGTKVTIDFVPFTTAAKLLYEGPWVAERWLATHDVKRESMLPVIQTIIGSAEGKTAADAFSAQYALQSFKKVCDAQVDAVDFMLTPTCPTQFTREALRQEPIKYNSVLGTYTNFMNLLDYAATSIPVGFTTNKVSWGVTFFSHAFRDIELLSYAGALHQALDLPQGASEFPLQTYESTAIAAPQKNIDVVVCGAHLEGFPLNWQLTERNATLVSKTLSAAKYQLYALPDGKRPAMIRDDEAGQAIKVEVWSMPIEHFGSFVAGIPAPLGIGKVELADGNWYCGFMSEGNATLDATKITEFGGWANYIQSKK
ncbi:allophanate hydrolase [Marinomonas sp. SBI22]|uniref:allophanate hydrolase n=1 Tax=unclassified Marinomonas TaxID=196814 RepID=UPI0007AF3C63|nr:MULTISPECIES: allophanate hydrolase [unclassified Marinomonas]KZM43728.1 allophanate hydrolase [Marinomonas sp. SBI22]KZM47290.1 allophanate hydrolase [Marinomonas sp. SBI8L]